MIINPDVGVYQTTPDNNCTLINQPAVTKLFLVWLKSEFGEHLATQA